MAEPGTGFETCRLRGLGLLSAEVMHLNRDCTYPDLSNLFVRSDVTEAVGGVALRVPGWIAEQVTRLAGPQSAHDRTDHRKVLDEQP